MHRRRNFLALSAGIIGLSGCSSDGGTSDDGGNDDGTSDDGDNGNRTSDGESNDDRTGDGESNGNRTSDDGDDDSATSDGESNDSGSESLEDRYPNHYAIHNATKLVVMSDIDASSSAYSVTITGTVINGSDTDYDYAQIEFGLYDRSGAKVGNAFDNISRLNPGQRWRFEAVGTGDNAASWELESMSAY